MRRTSAFFFRIILTFALIAAQIAWILAWYTSDLLFYSDLVMWLNILAAFIVVVFIVNKRDNSAYKIGWVTLVLLFPLFGAIMYLVAGNKNSSRRLRKKLGISHNEIMGFFEQDKDVVESLQERDKHMSAISKYLFNSAQLPVYKNTYTKYYPAGEYYFDDILEQLRKAEHYIYIEFFIIGLGTLWDEILDILKKKVSEGVDVRVIYDDFGSVLTLPMGYHKKLRAMGIKSMIFNKFSATLSFSFNNRDHRKIIIIDGHTAFTGGINIADEYVNIKERFGHWKDAGIKLKGDAVWSLALMFIETWNAFSKEKITDFEQYRPTRYELEEHESSGYVQPYNSMPSKDESMGQSVYLHLINYSVDYLYIYSPYLILDDECLKALCMASRRGVDVQIIMPGNPDKKFMYLIAKSFFPILLDSGIKINFYQPGFIHSKCVVCDDKMATIGTINMDFRSMYLHFENNVILYDTDSVLEIKNDFVETLKECKPAEEKDYKGNIFVGLAKAVMRVIAPLF